MVSFAWSRLPLGEVLTLQRGYDLPERLRKPGTVPIITSSGIGGTHSRAKVAAPGVVTGRYGTIGEVHYIDCDFWPLNTTLYVSDFHSNVPSFIAYLLQTIDFHSHSGKSGVPGVNRNDLHEVIVNLPAAKAEQEAIAQALIDADALIEALEQLIAKKRNIKQGAMQELLRPQNGWVMKKLGDTAVLKARIGWQGLTTSEYLKTGDYYLVTGTEFLDGQIDWENCHFVEESRFKQDKNIQIKELDVLVTKDGTIGKVALVRHLDKPATLNSGVFVIRPIDGAFDPCFFYYLLSSRVFFEFLTQLSAGSTINHLYQKDFVAFSYTTPQTIKEQIAIATILSDMDAEIVTLESKLTKARQIKQGMMQELLTGRIRLV